MSTFEATCVGGLLSPLFLQLAANDVILKWQLLTQGELTHRGKVGGGDVF